MATDPDTGQPTSELELVYPRLSARLVRVSADGRRLVSCRGDRVTNLHRVPLEAAAEARSRPLTSGTGQWEVHDVLADGTVLAALRAGPSWELFAIGPDDLRSSILRRDASAVGSAEVVASPDGSRIAIALGGEAPSVSIHDLADSRSRSIALPEAISNEDWSPDGRHLAAMTTSSADRIVVVDVEGGTAETVALQCGDHCAFAYEGIRFGPRWPYAAVTSEVDTWVVDVTTGALRHLAAATWSILAWRDGFVYFARGGGQNDWPGFTVFRVPEEGGAEERLVDLPVECIDYELDATGRSVICEVDESRLDLWLVDGLAAGA